jgi:hypothetical protein
MGRNKPDGNGNVISLESYSPEDEDPEVEEVLTGEPQLRDIDPQEWLAPVEVPVVGYFAVERLKGRVKIAALTDKETNNIMRASRRPDAKGRTKVNAQMSKLLCVAYSINKANGKLTDQGQFAPGAVLPQQLENVLGGEVVECYKAISRLSGFKEDNSDADEARAFLD